MIFKYYRKPHQNIQNLLELVLKYTHFWHVRDVDATEDLSKIANYPKPPKKICRSFYKCFALFNIFSKIVNHLIAVFEILQISKYYFQKWPVVSAKGKGYEEKKNK